MTNFFEISLSFYLSYLISSAFISNFFLTKLKIFFYDFTIYFHFPVYNVISVLPTINLVQNISMCNPSVIFVSNYCSPTIFMYPHFPYFVTEFHIQSINQPAINQFYKKKICLLPPPSFVGFMCIFYSRIQSFHALSPARATVAHKSNSLNPELKCFLSFLPGCIRSR